MRKAGLKIEYEVVVKDKNGKVLSRQKGVSKSLLTAFMRWLRSKFTIADSYADSWSCNDTTNTARSFPRTTTGGEYTFGKFHGLVNEDTHGLRVGTSDIAVDPADYELKARILQGVGAGQMVYGAQTYEAVDVVGMASRFRISRVFTNNSGGAITVKEIGGALCQMDSGGALRYLLYLRDVLAAPSTVPDGASLTVRYRFSVTA